MMKSTDQFRREQRRLGGFLAQPAGADVETFDAIATFDSLTQLKERLEAHVDAEIADLASYLMQQPDAAVRVRSMAFITASKGIVRFVHAFLERWPDAGSVAAAGARFWLERAAVFDAVRAHLRDEESTLYDLVDQLRQAQLNAGRKIAP